MDLFGTSCKIFFPGIFITTFILGSTPIFYIGFLVVESQKEAANDSIGIRPRNRHQSSSEGDVGTGPPSQGGRH